MAVEYKIVLVGDGGVGKSTWVKQLLTQTFEPRYIATMGAEVHPITINTSSGPITFNIWDCAGQDKYGGTRHTYYAGGDGAIVLCDATNRLSFRNCRQWIYDVKQTQENNNEIPMVAVINKCDIQAGYPNTINISAKQRTNLYQPLLMLARKITNDPGLEFIL
jgi:GTP-binding nuclear protein Ran